MPQLSHEQFDRKVNGLIATYEALSRLDFRPSVLTGGKACDNDVYSAGIATAPLGFDLASGIHKALKSLRLDVGCWGRLAHDEEKLIDQASPDERLEMAGILAMITAPKNEDRFYKLTRTIHRLLDNVVRGNPVIIEQPGFSRYIDGEWREDIRALGQHDGKIQVTFDSHDIMDREISIWSDRPDDTRAPEPGEVGALYQPSSPLLRIDLNKLATGHLRITYPATESVA